MSSADFDVEQPDPLKRWADSVRNYEPDPLKRWAASLPKLTTEQVIEAGSPEKVEEFTKQAEILSQTAPLGIGERMVAPSVETPTGSYSRPSFENSTRKINTQRRLDTERDSPLPQCREGLTLLCRTLLAYPAVRSPSWILSKSSSGRSC